MGRAILQCFHPLSMISRSSCPHLMEEDACVFSSSLLEGLKHLEQSLAEGSATLAWSLEAINLLKMLQIELLALLKRSNLPIAYEAEEDWFDQYMVETTALLDFCNSLKSVVSRISRYGMVLDLAIQGLLDADPYTKVSANNELLKGVEREGRKLADVAVTKGAIITGNKIKMVSTNKQEKSIRTVIVVAKITSSALSLLLFSAIVSPVSIDMGSEGPHEDCPQLEAFMVQLKSLIRRFQENMSRSGDSSGLVLFEHQMINRAVGDLKDQMVKGVIEDRNRFQSSVELLRTRSGGLRKGIEMFEAVVDEVFDVVIKGRNEMLGTAVEGTVSKG